MRLSREDQPVFLALSIVGALAFFGNVLAGAMYGSAFLSDVGEFLVMGATAVAFTVEILKREARAKAAKAGEKN